MGQSKLGLPLQYSKLHKYYDALCSDANDSTNALIERLLREHKVKTVLDLTCGTGSQVFWLAKHGYKVTGADFSPALLDIAKEKARQEEIDVRLIEGDMRTITVGHFDAVITIFNAVGHLTKADFEITMRNIHANLKDGGLYVFDIFNLEAMTDKVVDDLAMDISRTVNNTNIHHTQYSKINKDNGQLTSYDHFTIQEGSAKPTIYKEQFTLQIYTAKELRYMLTHNGFEVLEQYGIDGTKFLKHESLSIMTVARKV